MTVPLLSLTLAEGQLKAEHVTCPDCGGALQITPATAVDLLYGGNRTLDEGPRRVERETVIAACTACEFVLDLREAVR